jgi:predicted dehydrogenase
MSENPSRRRFLKKLAAGTAGAGLAMSVPARASASILTRRSPGETVTVAVFGTGGRGVGLAQSFARLENAEVAYVCDVDEQRMAEAAEKVSALLGRTPATEADLRRALEDRAVDAVVIAAPNHWHAPAAILAMQAGKHVYVEKPASHNPREGELLIEAMRRYERVVQMGNQRRSWPAVAEGIERVRSGVVGPVHYSRGWYANARGSIGRGKSIPPPDHVNYDLWQGPAPRTPYRDNILHYNWHWFWHWGSGELGNNGVHALDLCRWGLDVDYPARVSSAGGRYFWDDDQETPDTHVVSLEFDGGRSIVWEGLSCNRRGIDGTGFGASFHGRDGTVVIERFGYRVFDHAGELVEEVTGSEVSEEIGVAGPGFDIDRAHLTNFVQAIRAGERLRAPIDDGQKSTLLCHLGNIAQRTGRALKVDSASGRILDDPDAMRLWSREYEPGWEPRV